MLVMDNRAFFRFGDRDATIMTTVSLYLDHTRIYMAYGCTRIPIKTSVWRCLEIQYQYWRCPEDHVPKRWSFYSGNNNLTTNFKQNCMRRIFTDSNFFCNLLYHRSAIWYRQISHSLSNSSIPNILEPSTVWTTVYFLLNPSNFLQTSAKSYYFFDAFLSSFSYQEN